MDKLEWPGRFSLEVPSDWRVENYDSGVIEIVPSEVEAAFHVTYLGKTSRNGPSAGDVEKLLANFADLNSLRLTEDLQVQSRGSEEIRGVTSLEARAPTEDKPRYWELLIVSWNDAALRATCCHDDSTGETRKMARLVFATVAQSHDGGPRK